MNDGPRIFGQEWASDRPLLAAPVTRFAIEPVCPVCGAAEQTCTEDPHMTEIEQQQQTTQDVAPGFEVAGEDVYEEFYYPGSEVKGKRLVASKGQVVPSATLEAARESEANQSSVDQMVLASGATDPNDGEQPSENTSGLIAGTHAGKLDTYYGPEDTETRSTQQYNSAGVAIDDPSGVVPPEALGKPDQQEASESAATGDNLQGDQFPPPNEEIQQEPEAEEESVRSDQFDPSKYGVREVEAYLSGASESERQRVIEAEKRGKNRSTITGE